MLTYGWALILIATIVGILALIIATHGGLASLAQNALSAIIVIVAGAVALFGKLFFK